MLRRLLVKRQMTHLSREIEEAHQQAIRKGKDSYSDPSTGYQVLTSKFLQDRGSCCGNACRHCPYGHMNVKTASRRKNIIEQSVILNLPKSNSAKESYKNKNVSVLFWSGGKDSYLAYRQVKKDRPESPLVLLTTFGKQTQRVSIQDIHIQDIARQAKYLGVPCCLVPLTQNAADYRESVVEALQLVKEKFSGSLGVQELIFGDLKLVDILHWRKETFKEFQVTVPLFDRPYCELLKELWAARDELGVQIVVSASEVDSVKVGDVYNEEFVRSLPTNVDQMGENGEFHTRIVFDDQDDVSDVSDN